MVLPEFSLSAKKKTCGRSPFTNPVMIRIKQGSSVCSAVYGDIFMKVSRL